MEQWRDFPDFPEYEISDLGNVRRKAYLVHQVSDSAGYKMVWLHRGNHKAIFSVHRNVCRAFHGDGGPLHAAHLNGEKTDNRADNLVWATRSENMAHKKQHGTEPHGEGHYAAKLTTDDVRVIRQRAELGESEWVIAKDYPVARETVRDVIKRNTWKHVA